MLDALTCRFGADIRDGVIERVDFSSRPYHLWTDEGHELEADAVIIATGASAKYLGLADEEKYRGQGVSACATCDGFFYRKKVCAVVGGGDTACEDALYLSGLCKKVYLVVRKPFLRASKVMQERVMQAENIEILFEHNATGLYGENGVRRGHRRFLPRHRSYAQLRHLPRVAGHRRDRLPEDGGSDAVDEAAGRVRGRRRLRPCLPPGHRGRRVGM